MSAAKHTPGPWGVSYSTRTLVFKQGSNEQIAGCYGDEAPANARLIAAAPELLEALEFALRDMETTRSQFATHAPNTGVLAASIVIVRAAIAKATAQQPDPTR